MRVLGLALGMAVVVAESIRVAKACDRSNLTLHHRVLNHLFDVCRDLDPSLLDLPEQSLPCFANSSPFIPVALLGLSCLEGLLWRLLVGHLLRLVSAPVLLLNPDRVRYVLLALAPLKIDLNFLGIIVAAHHFGLEVFSVMCRVLERPQISFSVGVGLVGPLELLLSEIAA